MPPTFCHPLIDIQEQFLLGQKKHPADEIYMSPLELELTNSMPPIYAGTRNYIDPWDIENYVYLRRHIEETTDDELFSENDCDDNHYCVGLDEKSFYNYIRCGGVEPIYSIDNNSNCFGFESSASPPSLCSGKSGHFPKSQTRLDSPKLKFPAPPPFDYLELPSSDCSECLECSLSVSTSSPIYATNRERIYSTIAPNHFSLSKKGLLQIDYSCNWYNLDRYIGK